jgi:hypothetical protein
MSNEMLHSTYVNEYLTYNKHFNHSWNIRGQVSISLTTGMYSFCSRQNLHILKCPGMKCPVIEILTNTFIHVTAAQ